MALSSIFYFLLKDRTQLSKLRTELHASFRDIQSINDKELMKLPFLTGCINEALRLFPPVSGRFISRTSPGLHIDGVYVPKGVSGSDHFFFEVIPCLSISEDTNFCGHLHDATIAFILDRA
jgi:hypothetical protein